jgi:hypothetical protein
MSTEPSRLVAAIPTRLPYRELRVYLTSSGGLYVGEYEKRSRRGDFLPTAHYVGLPAERIPALRAALEEAEREPPCTPGTPMSTGNPHE